MDGVMGVTLGLREIILIGLRVCSVLALHPWIASPWSIPSSGTRGFLLGGGME